MVPLVLVLADGSKSWFKFENHREVHVFMYFPMAYFSLVLPDGPDMYFPVVWFFFFFKKPLLSL